MICVILCGGAGSRLWPLSREWYPKPLLRVDGVHSFIQKAFLRAAAVPETKGMLVVTNSDLRFQIADEFKQSGVKQDCAYILEPFGRNTGPAIVAALLDVRRCYGDKEPILVLPSDHLITNQDQFVKVAHRALELAREGRLVTFGISPTMPETGFGYIETDGENVVRFVEKPSREKALEYISTGRFLWNSGMFCFEPWAMLEELEKHAPELLASVEHCFDVALGTPDRDEAFGGLYLDPDAFAQAPSISIDYAVFEKSDRVAVVHGGDLGWSDFGSWTELCGIYPADSEGNRVNQPENAVMFDSHNCLVSNQDRLVTALGVDDLLIVDTPDALLVADKKRAQDVRLLYNQLKDKQHETYRHHRTIHRPWGSFTLLESGPRFKIKGTSKNSQKLRRIFTFH